MKNMESVTHNFLYNIRCNYYDKNNLQSDFISILSTDIVFAYIINLKIMIMDYLDIADTCLLLYNIVYFKYLVT